MQGLFTFTPSAREEGKMADNLASLRINAAFSKLTYEKAKYATSNTRFLVLPLEFLYILICTIAKYLGEKLTQLMKME